MRFDRWRAGLFVVTSALLAAGDARAVTEPPPEPIHLGLYEWMATAPVVAAVDILADDGKYIQAVTRTPIKGALREGELLLIDLRKANRDREVGVKSLDLAKGKGYLLLLVPSTRSSGSMHTVYDLVRGMAGARPLPAEGAQATVEAASRLAKIQERKNDDLLWASVGDMLDDPNPVLVGAALELVVKFRRESVALLPVVGALLESPRPDVRGPAALLVGRILARPEADAVPERGELVGELTGRARRDDDPFVRRTATTALAGLKDPGVDETLRTISKDDPDQEVRFEAEKSLYMRKQAAENRRSD